MSDTTQRAWYRARHWQVLLGLMVGALIGLFGGAAWEPYYGWLGDLFLNALKMVAVPLIVSSITVGVARLGSPQSIGRLGGAALLYYVGSSALAILVGLVAVNLIRPGIGVDLGVGSGAHAIAESTRSIGDVLLDIIPVNPVGAVADFGSPGAGSGLVGVIFFCIVFGLGTAALEDKKRDAILGLFDAIFAAMLKITDVIIALAPIGVAALIGRVLALTGLDVLLPLAGYMMTVIVALGVHFFATVPLLIFLLARRNPFTYMKQVGMALATAFTTASSNATLPVSLEVAEEKAGVDRRVTGFVLPLGATVNMDGSALYEGVAALFVAQAYGHHLGIEAQALLFVTALLASIGAAGIPHGSLVMMSVVFQAVGLPLDAIGLLLGVDRVLTMCRTATNVWSDLAGAAIVDRLVGVGSLAPLPTPAYEAET